MQISTLGIDLSKTVFHAIGLNGRGEIVLRRKFSRKQLLHFTSNKQQMLIGMEACDGAHFLSRALRTEGHDARLMPAQFVKAFRKSNKNDYLDAEAIAEAVQRPTMRFVPMNSADVLRREIREHGEPTVGHSMSSMVLAWHYALTEAIKVVTRAIGARALTSLLLPCEFDYYCPGGLAGMSNPV
jgi:hypothetical protein